MKHESYLELMSAALDGALTDEERKTLDEHLSQCPDCAALYQELSAQSEALRGLDCEMPAGLHTDILAGLPSRTPARKHSHVKRWAALAACLVLVAVAALTARSILPGMAPGTDGAALSGGAPSEETVSQEPEVPATPRPTPAARSAPPVTVPEAPQEEPGDTPESAAPDSPPVKEPAGEPAPAAIDEPAESEPIADVPSETAAPAPDPAPEPAGEPEPVESAPETAPAEDGKIVPGMTQYGHIIGSLAPLPGIAPIAGEAGSGETHSFSNEQSFRVTWSDSLTSSARILGSADSLSSFLTTYGLTDEPGLAYGGDFFQEHRLLAVVVTAGSGSIRFSLDPDGLTDTQVNLLVKMPDAGTADMAAWVIIAEVDSSYEDGQVLTLLSGGGESWAPAIGVDPDPNAPVAY